MKRLFFVFVLVLVGIIVAYVLRYERGVCICNQIPASAETVILVNARNLEHHLLVDAITHPLEYFGREEAVSKDSIAEHVQPAAVTQKTIRLADCLTLPSHVLIYKASAPSASWSSSYLSIKDRDIFESYLLQEGFKLVDNTDGSQYVRGDQAVVLAGASAKLVYQLAAGSLEELVLTEEDYLEEGDAMFDMLKASSDDAVLVDKDGQQLVLNFIDGQILVEGQYTVPQLRKGTSLPTQDVLGLFAANFDSRALIEALPVRQRDQFSNFTKLELDSLAQYWDGSIYGAVTEMVTVADTITSYDYDDDFNQIEVQKIKQRVIPSYAMHMGISKEGISYMKRKNAIVDDAGQDVLAIMPLVKTFATSTSDGISFYTGSATLEAANSDHKVYLSVDLKDYRSATAGTPLAIVGKMESITNFLMTIDEKDHIKAALHIDSDRNALATLVSQHN